MSAIFSTMTSSDTQLRVLFSLTKNSSFYFWLSMKFLRLFRLEKKVFRVFGASTYVRLILQRLTHHPARAQHKNDANSSVKSTFWHRITDLASHDESIARHIQLTRCLLLRVAREWREAWFGRLIDELSARNSSCMLASKRAESYVDLFDDATWFRSDMVICGCCGARKLNSRPKKTKRNP